MLSSLSSREITEWRAYEYVAGPVGPEYQNETLRHLVNLMTMQVTGEDLKQSYPTAAEWFKETHPLTAEEA